MANTPKLLSGRVPVTPYNELSNSRHEFLGLSQAEPNLGTGSNGSILTISTNNQRVFSNTITISGNTATIKNLDVTGNIIAANITANGDANFSGNTVRLGAVSNVKITGGNTGQVLTTDGAGNLSFTTASGGQMPYYIPAGESYIIEEYKQGLFAVPITVDGDLYINGLLVQVSY
jgi:hypothetical protein